MEKKMLSPSEICDEVVNVGIKKGNSSTTQLIILGILAGMFIALGAFAASMFSHSIENPGIQKFTAGVVFPVGLILVLICGGELFTGNTLIIVAMYEKKINLKQVLRNWIIVYLANFIGAFIVAFLVLNSGLLGANGGKLGGYVINGAIYKGGLSFVKSITSGILCNILVCVALWGAYAAKDISSKILIIWFPVMTFVVSGFEHSVANMYYFSVGILAKTDASLVKASYLGDKLQYLDFTHAITNLIPVTLGNIIGGSLFVGTTYWLAFKYIPSFKKSRISSNINR